MGEDTKIYRIEAAGGVVISPGGLVLMMLRRGMWDLPKGHREPGETLRECAGREVREECGLRAEFLEIGEELARTVHRYFNETAGQREEYSEQGEEEEKEGLREHFGRTEEKHVTWFRMLYRGDPNDVAPQTEEDITELRWVTLEEARQLAEESYDTIRKVVGKL